MPRTRRPLGRRLACMLVVLTPLLLTARSPAAPPDEKEEPKVTEIPGAAVEKFKLDTTFYKKHVDYKGFSILGSDKVSDEALLEARYLIDQLLHDREDIL